MALWRLCLGIGSERGIRIERYLRILGTLGRDRRIGGRRREHGVGRLLEGRITGGVGVHGHYQSPPVAVLLAEAAVRIGMPGRTGLGSFLK